MEVGTGQRRENEAAPCPRHAPAVVVRTPRQARAALALAGPRGVVLLSPPGAAGNMGAAWFTALVAAARDVEGSDGVPAPHWAVLDCGNAPGFALWALRRGARLLILDPATPAFPAVAAAAAELGATLWAERPPALDLGGSDRGGGRRLAEWLAGPAVADPPGLG